MLNFEVKNYQLPVIQVNFEEMKKALTETMKQYTGILVTEDSLSLAKVTQKELASMRIKIDNYRKEKKKEVSKPIDVFEKQCKELISLVEDAEKPIKVGIEIFDNQKREEKRQTALKGIDGIIIQYELNSKYSSQLTVLDKYTNLTAKPKEVLEDIENRAKALKEQQNKDIEMLLMIKDAIGTANKTINTPLAIDDFQSLINMGMSAREVIQEVNKRADRIKKAELQAIADKEAEAEREKLAEAERIRIENLPKEVIKEPEPIEEDIPIFNDEPEPIETIEMPTIDTVFFKDIRVKGTKFDVVKVEQFLRENNYNFAILDEGKF